MSDKKNKRVVLKIKKKPLLKRLEKIFTGKTNLDVAEEQRRLNPPNTIPRGKYKHQLQNRNKIYVDPNTGEERYIEGLTKPHYSELEQFPFKDDPVFAKEQSSQYITEREKTRQFIKNVLKQNKKSIELPQSEGDQKIIHPKKLLFTL